MGFLCTNVLNVNAKCNAKALLLHTDASLDCGISANPFELLEEGMSYH